MTRARPLVGLLAMVMILPACSPRRLAAGDMPAPTAGLWMRSGGVAGAVSRGDLCWSGRPLHIPGAAKACGHIDYARVPGGVEINAVCGDDQVGTRVRMRFVGDFQRDYRVDTEDRLSIAGQKPRITQASNHFTFQGPCPPGRAADDLE